MQYKSNGAIEQTIICNTTPHTQKKSSVTKSRLGPILGRVKSDKLEEAICSLRISNHILMIEKGRYQVSKFPRDLCICPMCNDDIEDEVQFLCHCTSYEVPRKTIYDKLKADLSMLPVNEIAALILNPDTSSCYQNTALFIYSCLISCTFSNSFVIVMQCTVEPLLSGHPLSGHPLLSGQLSKSRNYCR